jgi:hypothetical protein
MSCLVCVCILAIGTVDDYLVLPKIDGGCILSYGIPWTECRC